MSGTFRWRTTGCGITTCQPHRTLSTSLSTVSTIKAVAQTSKEGFLYVFDRKTGKLVWPIEERPVPQSTIPGEQTSPTQPFPTKPAALDRQGVTEADVVDFTPELHAQAMAALAKYNYGPLFTPESLEKTTIMMPGNAGGSSWSGAACDPETGTCYAATVTSPTQVELVPSEVPHTGYRGNTSPVPTMNGVPLWKPPYGRLTAIDLNTGDRRWVTPLGDSGRTGSSAQAARVSRISVAQRVGTYC